MRLGEGDYLSYKMDIPFWHNCVIIRERRNYLALIFVYVLFTGRFALCLCM